jgi:hypothetical protein
MTERRVHNARGAGMTREHEMSGDCWCKPRVTRVPARPPRNPEPMAGILLAALPGIVLILVVIALVLR